MTQALSAIRANAAQDYVMPAIGLLNVLVVAIAASILAAVRGDVPGLRRGAADHRASDAGHVPLVGRARARGSDGLGILAEPGHARVTGLIVGSVIALLPGVLRLGLLRADLRARGRGGLKRPRTPS